MTFTPHFLSILIHPLTAFLPNIIIELWTILKKCAMIIVSFVKSLIHNDNGGLDNG